TGHKWIENSFIEVNGNEIEAVNEISELKEDSEVINFGNNLIVPGFIDFQVYGAGGKLLSAYPDKSTLEIMHKEFLKDGTVLFQPTIATNTVEVFKKCIDAVREYWKAGGTGVAGLHLEGPWINEAKRGAHLKELIHSPELKEVEEILEYGKGIIKTITLAPEVVKRDVIKLIQSYGIIISAGHSNATYSEAIQSFDAGIPMVTHLYNAMSSLMHRAPGLVGASFNNEKVIAAIIPDGHHVDYSAIQIAKKIMMERLFAITDAVTETKIGPYQHQLVGDKYESNGILSGSAISMYQAFLNLVKKVCIDVDDALKMCSRYPAKALGMEHLYGTIQKGSRLPLLVMNKDFELENLIID
ncbi:MAG TPA: N-acetylglucosamine-6-phosphate deacetylase, partial [Flavisolibacter sp.]|nr:N-acetylglucosamine-6-phosphate deacetylase [Flavisolibacter sp.]